jgi:hypothetical protein
METTTMGRVFTEATIENLGDLYELENGRLTVDQVRRITVNAVVDTVAMMLSLPAQLIRQLGLRKTGKRRIRSALGVGEADIYGAVRLTIMGRDCPVDVMEVPDECRL